MNQDTHDTLELDSLLGILVGHAQTPMGRKMILALRPTTERRRIEHALDLTSECVEYLEAGFRFGLSGLDDPAPSLAQLNIEGTTLEPQRIYGMELVISAGMELRREFRDAEMKQQYPLLTGLISSLPDLRNLLSEIKGKVLPSGEVDENASPELRKIRKQLFRSRSRIHSNLESILRRQARAIQEDVVTFRNGRFVIPVRTDSRSTIPGVMHGLSSSGQTTFVEPMSVIDQNNDLVQLKERETSEIGRILSSICQALRNELPALHLFVETLGELDLVQAKAFLSRDFKCCRPTLAEEGQIMLRGVRHIILEHTLQQSAGSIVPISLKLDESQRAVVISGPNAGGKTVVLKTVGLAALMTQMGLHVPAEEASLPVFRQIFADIGDHQSIAANLSTFTAHIKNISQMARRIDPPALVLLDEIGTGTDPDEGAALAISLIDHFQSVGATTIATTHYNELKMWASQTDRVLNASVEFDHGTLRPTYRLTVGIAGGSAGLEIARRMNLPDKVLQSAKNLMHPDHIRASEYLRRTKAVLDEQEALQISIEEERLQLETLRQDLEQRFSRREEARRLEFESRVEEIISEFKTDSARLIGDLKERAAERAMKKVAARSAARLKRKGSELGDRALGKLDSTPAEERHSAQEPLSPPPREGDLVYVSTLKKEGTLDSIHEHSYIVRVGSLKYHANLEEIAVRKSAQSAPPAGQPSSQSGAILDQDDEVPRELNVIGSTSDEATYRVDKFIDEAFYAGADILRIIHGYGKGVLRREIAELLTGHQQVDSFSPAPPHEGGGGATIVRLKK